MRCRARGHPFRRLIVLDVGANRRVSAPIPVVGTDVYVDICSLDEGAGDSGTGESELVEKSDSMCPYNDYPNSPLTVLVAMGVRKGSLLKGTAFHADDKTKALERFGPLKSVLEAIPTVYANDKVRSQHRAQVLR